MDSRGYAGVVLLAAGTSQVVLQRRPLGVPTNAGRIVTFGGFIEQGEHASMTALRELSEELELTLGPSDLQPLCAVDQAPHAEGNAVRLQMFFYVATIQPDHRLVLHEGASIERLDLDSISGHPEVATATRYALAIATQAENV